MRAMSEDPEPLVTVVDSPVEIPLPVYLRSLQPHMMLKGWLLPVVFAVVTVSFWDWSGGKLDWAPHTHRFEAYCFGTVTVLCLAARLWVGWRVRRARAGQ
jgi:hypothetical protein